jgi:predicted DNA-binding transcriptional regulator AlpA
MKTVDAGNVLVFLDVTKTERKRLLAAAENEPVKKKQKLLTKKQAAELLGVCPETVKRYANRGMLHPIRLSQRMVRYGEDEVLALLHVGE